MMASVSFLGMVVEKMGEELEEGVAEAAAVLVLAEDLAVEV